MKYGYSYVGERIHVPPHWGLFLKGKFASRVRRGGGGGGGW